MFWRLNKKLFSAALSVADFTIYDLVKTQRQFNLVFPDYSIPVGTHVQQTHWLHPKFYLGDSPFIQLLFTYVLFWMFYIAIH